MREEHLATIREACIKANPEIETMPEAYAYTLRVIRDLRDRRGLGQEWEQIDDEVRGEIEDTWATLIGRPIHLADVLLARKKSMQSLTWLFAADEKLAELVDRWNLRQDELTQQSDECLEFLAELLKEKDDLLRGSNLNK